MQKFKTKYQDDLPTIFEAGLNVPIVGYSLIASAIIIIVVALLHIKKRDHYSAIVSFFVLVFLVCSSYALIGFNEIRKQNESDTEELVSIVSDKFNMSSVQPVGNHVFCRRGSWTTIANNEISWVDDGETHHGYLSIYPTSGGCIVTMHSVDDYSPLAG